MGVVYVFGRSKSADEPPDVRAEGSASACEAADARPEAPKVHPTRRMDCRRPGKAGRLGGCLPGSLENGIRVPG